MKKIEKLKRNMKTAGVIFFSVLTMIVFFLGVDPGASEGTRIPDISYSRIITIENESLEPVVAIDSESLESPADESQAEAVEPTPIVEATQYYDIPLSEDMQDYIFELSEQYKVPAEVVIAIIDKESSYRANVVGQAGELGYMQIHPINFEQLQEILGITDFKDPKQNIHCGVYLLSKLYAKYDTTTEVLMCYNCGEGGAKRQWDKGVTETTYTQKIQTIISNLQPVGGDCK